jgi:hypothetical protein
MPNTSQNQDLVLRTNHEDSSLTSFIKQFIIRTFSIWNVEIVNLTNTIAKTG